MCLTPTQGFMTCDMIRRKTEEKAAPFMICRACGSTLRRHQNGLKCRKCHVWACSMWCLPPFLPWWVCPWRLRMDSRCRSIWPHPLRARRSRRAALKPRTLKQCSLGPRGAGDVTAGDANHQAPAAGPEAEDVHNTQEAVATSHALSSPMDQARIPPG